MPLNALDLTVSYPSQPRGRRPALVSASCTIMPGRVTAIIGPNGAGKSTLLRALAGVIAPASGRVELDGTSIGDLDPRDRARRVALAVQQPGVAFGFHARRVIAFGAEGGGSPDRSVEREMERFSLTDIGDRPFDELSVGQRQRVSLARAFAQLDARAGTYLLADEPISAMDPRHAVRAVRSIRTLADSGVGVGIVLHDLSVAAQLADEAVMIGSDSVAGSQGPAVEVLASGPLSDRFGTPLLRKEMPGVGPLVVHPGPVSHDGERSGQR
ncbi:MAG: ABC transporter ATP-binding protein [Planctomycetota bacterium]